MSEHRTLTDWLAAELDKKLAAKPTDQARYRELCLQTNWWNQALDKFCAFGTQPFTPHPIYGPFDLFDFRAVLCMIDGAKSKLERVPA